MVGEQALSFLEQIGRLSYELLEFAPAQRSPGETGRLGETKPGGTPSRYVTPPQRAEPPQGPGGPAPPSRVWYPARTAWGEQVFQNPLALSRDQRRVLALIDGRRSVADLARLLGFSAAVLEAMLRSFQEQNLIR